MNFKIGLCSISFRNLSPAEIIDNMKKVGLSVIEWGSDVHALIEKVEEIARLQRQHNIICCSYGTYFVLGQTPLSELKKYIDAAKILGTDILRLWCGNKNSEEFSEEEKAQLFAECEKATKIAEQNGAILCMECHNNTYTNTAKSALELIKAVDSDCFKMYWQPNQFKTEQENLDYASLLSQYTVNIHVFNWEGDKRYPLSDAKAVWQRYLTCFDNKQLLLEFMPDDKIESLKKETQALKEIVG